MAQPVNLTLPGGWSPLAFQCNRITSLSPGLTALAYYRNGQYEIAPPSLELVNAGEGGRRACWAFCATPAAVTYDGNDEGRDSFVNLQAGWNLVSTASSQPVQVQFDGLIYLIETNGAATPVGSGSPLLPGRAYWVFATAATRLNFGPTITALEVTPSTATINRYGSVQLTARGRLADGTLADVSRHVDWTSSVPSAVGISPLGLATGLFPGVYNVTAGLQGFTATSQVTVTDAGSPGGAPPPASTRRAQLRVSNIENPANSGQLLAYNSALTATGTVNPGQTITMQTTPTIQYPFAIALDAGRDILYVAMFSGGAERVDVYSPANAATPVRSLTGITGGAQSLALDTAANRLYVGAAGGNGLFIFDNASTVNGAGTPRRVTTFTGGVNALELDVANNRLFATIALSGFVNVFDNAATMAGTQAGTVSRTFGVTAIGSTGLEYDATRNQLYLSNFATGQILVYSNPGALTGTPATTRSFTTLPPMTNPRGLFLDGQADELYVAGGAASGYVRVFATASTADSTVTPARTITGVPLQQTNSIVLDFSRD